MQREYYEAKAVAQVALGRLFDSGDPRILTGDVQFEPYKGWVIMVLIPEGVDASDLEARGIEVQRHGAKPGSTSRSSRASSSSPSISSPGPASAPVKGATAKVWEIADSHYQAAGEARRKEIIGACEAAGIHPATAATQYSKWKKARGL